MLSPPVPSSECLLCKTGYIAYLVACHLHQLARIQTALMQLLGEKSQFTQEAAARGLALVFDCAEGTFREGLVKDLLGTLTGTRKTGAAARAGTCGVPQLQV